MKPLEAIRCTHPRCRCECFAPGRQSLRYCETCTHGWVAHALDKLGANLGLKVEMVQPNIVFDIASLMLYGAQATPVRLKILLDRLFAELQHEEILQILHGFGWTYEDYARGYILQDKVGHVIDNWCMATHEEELVVLQQFLRFGETKTIAQEIILQDIKNSQVLKQTHAAESGIKRFLERSNLPIQNYTTPYEYAPKCFVTTPFQFVPSANRIISAPVMPQICSPGSEPHFLSLLQAPIASSTPLNISPLHHLDILKHSDSLAEQSVVRLNHEGLDNCRTPNCDSPQDLSNASSSSHQSLQTHQRHQGQGSDGKDGSDSHMSGSDDDVIDYSKSHISSSPLDENAVRHVRKSKNPTKREWTQSANFDNTFMGSNGKKRALCTACNKTFCDKGALKIHYSAVHLKEMHKCTVEGCQMMFSSRRSRNRHSANLNPKLHMPQKLTNDFDHAEDDFSKSNGLVANVASSSSANSAAPTTDAPPVHLQTPAILNTQNSVIAKSNPVDFLTTLRKRIKLEHDQSNIVDRCPDDVPFDLSKKLENVANLEVDLDRCNNEKEATIQETKKQWVTQKTLVKALSACKQNDQRQFDEGTHALNHDRDQMLHVRKNPTIENTDVVRSSNTINVENPGGLFQKGGSSHSEDSHEIRERKEERHFPKSTSLQVVDCVKSLGASTDLSNNEALLTADATCTINETKNKQEIAAAASSRVQSEENQLPSGNDTIEDMESKYPYQCKICCKNFTESFFLNIHFQKHHLNYMIPSVVDRSPAHSPPKNN